ncbi:MAG: bifunctional 4-hydroxy-3-methylbut-2-enyl diphosphate reductase/30S ribosomal protein S1 [Ruminococcaceae bacterium]|nr:bifunctional 4-hydroxy-3-methylbut-2-enyl diphosphate reductase/30S ribosomal protein S1 [Oscillospiraceae bacterium]
MGTVTVAKNAGFCFGVKRATDCLERALDARREGERIYTLGHLIHNETYNAYLEDRGVRAVSAEEIEDIAKAATEAHPVTLLIRAHGCTRETLTLLDALALANPFFQRIDCTCPYVKKIHRIAAECDAEECFFVLLGAASHPEVVGIMSWFDGEKYVFSTPEELESSLSQCKRDDLHKKRPVMVAQTTQNLVNWNKSQKIIKKLYTNAEIFDTICSVTELRQTEAKELARRCDSIIVIGGRESSNTAKLYEICRSYCGNTVWISSAEELDRSQFIAAQNIGIVAGASTPSGEIQEVYKTMSEMKENFEEMLESQCLTLNTGDVVTGTVTHVSDAEIQLDVGAGVTGYIKADQISNDPAFKLTENFKNGDKVEAFVIRVSDIEGVAELSKKRADADKNWKTLVEACESKAVLEGKVTEAVKGGVVIFYNANRVFVPASQTGVPKDGDLSALVGTTVSFKVIEIKQGKKAIGSIRVVLREERRAQEAEFWAGIEVGKAYHGTVKSLTSFGAFVDLGGVDGMVHLTELSWKHIKNPAEVVAVGDELDVFVKSFDPEKKRISLGYKTEASNPWNIFKSQYAIGDIASVKIVNMMPFGAFAEIIDGVDGLIHISQIAMKRIAKPADMLEIGQVVDARIIDIDDEKKNVSLSIRSLLEEAASAAEAMPEDYVAEDTVEEEATTEEQ